jgi:uncharacterized protein YbaP (TraB family)
MASLGLNTPNLPPVAQRVPPAKRAALAEAIKKTGFPPQAFDRMETWAVAINLLGLKFRELSLGRGVEPVLRDEFAASNKPIGELESNLEQLSYFDRLPEAAQRNLLEGAIENSGSMKREFSAMLDAWTRGDVKQIAKTFDSDLATVPAMRDALIRQRNANWAKWIGQRMKQPGTIMVAVGAGHLAGSQSVVEALKKDGFKVTRIE